ncbi:MAG TPA: hypothetical protein EYP04_04955 [Anaerolineae bacterium]|nr:hypothetical protein [Anaerolineae bacterium]
MAVLKPGRALGKLEREIGTLVALQREGLPIPKIFGVTRVRGRPAYVMERFAQGWKNIVRTTNGKVTVVGSSSFLNARSVDDLKRIRKLMHDKRIWVDDLQFLIASDGRVVIADPKGLTIGEKGPSRVNIETINKLLEVAS